MTSEEQLLARRDALWDERAVFMDPTDKSPLGAGELRCLKQIHAELTGIDEELAEEGYGLEGPDRSTWSAAKTFTPPTRDRPSRRIQELREELDRMEGEPDRHQAARGQTSLRAAFHEAGHAVAFAVRGALPTGVTLKQTSAEQPHDPVALLAGTEAALLAGFVDEPSASDEALLEEAWRRRGQTKMWRPGHEAEARDVLAAYWPAVSAVPPAVARADLCRDAGGTA